MEQMNEVRWGIIGCGDVVEHKSGPAFNQIPGSRLVAVMRRDGKKAADFARRHGVPKWYDDADRLIDDPEVNAVYVATPPGSHARYAIRAMRAGKAVYVEKPMALNEAECRDMIAASRTTGQALFVAYYRRALPFYERIRALLEMEAIGDIRLVNVQLHLPLRDEELGPDARPGWRVQPAISGGGHFHDLASHQLDFLEYALGPIQVAGGIAANQAARYEAEDIVTAVFQFETGVLGTGSWCFTAPKHQRMDVAEILGSRGKITFSFFGAPVLHIETEGGLVENVEIPHPNPIQLPMITQVVDHLLGRGICLSTGESGMRATMLLDQICGR
jgi:predicted dehydrogenase